jgi:hypothetical protein
MLNGIAVPLPRREIDPEKLPGTVVATDLSAHASEAGVTGSRTALSGFLQLGFRHPRACARHNEVSASHSEAGSLTEGSSCIRWI